MFDRIELKERAKQVFAACRWPAVAVSLIHLALTGGGGGGTSGFNNNFDSNSAGSSSAGKVDVGAMIAIITAVLVVLVIAMIVGLAITTFVSNPVEIGTRRFFMMAREGNVNFREIAFSFSNGYIKCVVTMLLRNIFIFLWSLLFVIPGIIKSYEYRMIPYILAENPDIDRKDAFELSKKMMDGQKWDTFILDLSFIGWALLTGITCGIVGIFYYFPYYNCTCAELYAALRDQLIVNDPKAGSLLPGFNVM